jgi:hypothetical protein
VKRIDGSAEQVTDEDRQFVLTIIAALGEAIAAKDWPFARHMWSLLTPLHPTLIEGDAKLAHLAAVLIDVDPLVYSRSTAIH